MHDFLFKLQLCIKTKSSPLRKQIFAITLWRNDFELVESWKHWGEIEIADQAKFYDVLVCEKASATCKFPFCLGFGEAFPIRKFSVNVFYLNTKIKKNVSIYKAQRSAHIGTELWGVWCRNTLYLILFSTLW